MVPKQKSEAIQDPGDPVVERTQGRQLRWLSTYYGVEAVPMYVGPAIRASHT